MTISCGRVNEDNTKLGKSISAFSIVLFNFWESHWEVKFPRHQTLLLPHRNQISLPYADICYSNYTSAVNICCASLYVRCTAPLILRENWMQKTAVGWVFLRRNGNHWFSYPRFKRLMSQLGQQRTFSMPVICVSFTLESRHFFIWYVTFPLNLQAQKIDDATA